MTVYVDRPRYEERVDFRKMVFCHMTADTREELLEMADKIGVSRHWIDDSKGRTHFDICKSKRKLAIEYGAEVVPDRAMPGLARACKSEAEVKSQQAADERVELRGTLMALRTMVETQLNLENSLVADEPEGTVVIRIDLSKTIAEKLVSQLRRAESMI